MHVQRNNNFNNENSYCQGEINEVKFEVVSQFHIVVLGSDQLDYIRN